MAGWTGPGFVDAHAHLLRTAGGALPPYRLGDPSSIATWHRDVHARSSTPMDEERDAPASATALQAALERAAAAGLVEIWEAGVDVDAYLPALQHLREAGPLPLRVRLLMSSGTARPDRPRLGDPWVEIAGVKFYADGWLGPRTCAMCRPFADRPADVGVLFLDAETLARRAGPFADAGWVVATHAIGDRAIEAVLDGYDRVLSGQRPPAGRFRVEHAQCLHPDTISRMAAMGVRACIQPCFAHSDRDTAHAALDRAPDQMAYRWDALLAAGVDVVAGSDFPIETLRPLTGLSRLLEGVDALSPPLPWAGAFGLMTDARCGTTTLDGDPARLSPREIAQLAVLATDPTEEP